MDVKYIHFWNKDFTSNVVNLVYLWIQRIHYRIYIRVETHESRTN